MHATSPRLPDRDLVLVGAGHTNLHVVRQWRQNPIPGVRLTVVSPFRRATYSGMLPGTLAGLYSPEEMEIDLQRLVPACGGRLVVAEAIGLDPQTRRLELSDRPAVPFDVVSVGIGSVPAQRTLWERESRVVCIKPMMTFRGRLSEAIRQLAPREHARRSADDPVRPLRIVVVGGGAGGTEVALGVEAWLRTQAVPAQLTLLDSHDEILPGYSRHAIRTVRDELNRRGVRVRCGSRVVSVDRQEWPAEAGVASELVLHLATGDRLDVDLAVWAVGAVAPPALAGFRVPRDDAGFLEIFPTLQSTGGGPVFAVGDSAAFVSDPLPKAGVYAVREGPVLWENLQRFLSGRELVEYRPQRKFLSLLSLGDGRAVAEYRGWSASGHWVWNWKDRIDRRFMRMYQNVSADGMPGPGGAERSQDSGTTAGFAMRCAGCGSKVAGSVLSAALRRLNLPEWGDLETGAEGPDDAVVLDRVQTPVDVFSVDFFPAFLDDPFVVGRIAALHALSDLWAMGAQPAGALAQVTLPAGRPSQQEELLFQLLAGALRELEAANARLWGGHTIEGPELQLGFSVAGCLHGLAPWRKANLRPGDQLILTKSLGTGSILLALSQAAAPAAAVDAALAGMLRSNAAAAQVARDCEIRAATDVTGFGLAGHLLEMLEASRCSARVTLEAVPVLPGSVDLLASGFISSLAPANQECWRGSIEPRGGVEQSARWPVLFDPQTSGGLLLAASTEQAPRLVERLRSGGDSTAAWIGEVTATGSAHRLTIE